MPADMISVDDARSLPTDELRRMLASDLELTAVTLRRMAVVVAELESRGEDLSDLKIGLVPYLRLIASGQLAASAVVRFASRPQLLNAIGFLPLSDQERLGQGESVQLAVATENGITHRLVDPIDLHGSQIRQVFGDRRLNSIEQQIPLLEHQKSREKAKRPREGRIVADREKGGIIVGKTFVSRQRCLGALAELSGPEDTSSQRAARNAVRLTDEEHKNLRIAAVNADLSMEDMIRQCLRAAGVL